HAATTEQLRNARIAESIAADEIARLKARADSAHAATAERLRDEIAGLNTAVLKTQEDADRVIAENARLRTRGDDLALKSAADAEALRLSRDNAERWEADARRFKELGRLAEQRA